MECCHAALAGRRAGGSVCICGDFSSCFIFPSESILRLDVYVPEFALIIVCMCV